MINHLQKMILTSDAATILKELDVIHPAAKLLVMACQQQEAEMGDATNMVIVFAGELLKKAEELIRMGLKTSDIVLGYERAQVEALKILSGRFLLLMLEFCANLARSYDRQGGRPTIAVRIKQSSKNSSCIKTKWLRRFPCGPCCRSSSGDPTKRSSKLQCGQYSRRQDYGRKHRSKQGRQRNGSGS